MTYKQQHIKNPRDLPVEISAMFERASFMPVRLPAEGKGYETRQMAFGARMYLARLKSQMLRSTELPKGFRNVLQSIQFKQPSKGEHGWFFTVEPVSNRVIDTVKEIMGDVGPADEFWKQFESGEQS